MTVRSAAPGRQRWDVGIVRDRPRAARRIESELARRKGIRSVSANPLTGRILILHDESLSDEDVSSRLRTVVTRVAKDITPKPATGATPGAAGERNGVTSAVVSEPAPSRLRSTPEAAADGGWSGLLTGLAVTGAAAVTLGALFVPVGPLLGLGAVAGATAAVVRTEWHESGAAEAAAPVATLSRIAGGRKVQVAAASAASALAEAVELALSSVASWIGVVILTGESSVLTAVGVCGASTQLLVLCGGIAVIGLASVGLSYAAGVRWRRLGQDIEQDWRDSTYRHVQRLELRHLEDEGADRVAATVLNDSAQLGRLFSDYGAEVVQVGTMVLILVPAFLALAPEIAWVAFLPVPVVTWLSFRFRRRSATRLAETGTASSALTERVTHNLEASATVKSFSAEEHEARRIQRLGETYRESEAVSNREGVLYTETVRTGATASMVSIMTLGGRAVLADRLGFEVFSPLVGPPQQLLVRLPRLGPAVESYQATAAALERLEHLRALPAEPTRIGRRLNVGETRGELLLDDVTFTYPGRGPALSELTLRFAPRTVTAIVGATGSGKTTVAKLLMRFREPDSGRVLLDGVDVRTLRLDDVRDAIAYVPQDAYLFDETIADNIRYGSFGAPDRKVTEAARTADADGFVRSLPEGYHTRVGEGGRTLSGGQRQRLTLARAMLKGSPIAILDEATSSVDNETEAAIQKALSAFAETRTMIVIAHRMSTIRHADWIYVLDDGGVLAEAGTHDELVARGGRYASLWRLQVGESA